MPGKNISNVRDLLPTYNNTFFVCVRHSLPPPSFFPSCLCCLLLFMFFHVKPFDVSLISLFLSLARARAVIKVQSSTAANAVKWNNIFANKAEENAFNTTTGKGLLLDNVDGFLFSFLLTSFVEPDAFKFAMMNFAAVGVFLFFFPSFLFRCFFPSLFSSFPFLAFLMVCHLLSY